MRSRLVAAYVLVFMAMFVVGVVVAQEKSPVATAVPVLSDLDGLTIDNARLERDNLALQIQQATAQLEKMTAALNALIEKHAKPGHAIVKVDGKLVYQVKPPDPKKEPEPKK